MRAVPAGEQTPLVAQYLMDKVPGLKFTEGLYVAFAFMNDADEFVGGCVLSNYRQTDIEISCAAETPAAFRPQVMAAVFAYVYEQLGCVRCTSITTKRNKRARDFLTALGFSLEGNVRLGYDGTKDALVYGLLRSECRYITPGGSTNG
jgi:RimJ/RimL family protein N-acetyltransferase